MGNIEWLEAAVSADKKGDANKWVLISIQPDGGQSLTCIGFETAKEATDALKLAASREE
jgi:hypothetical protein